MRSIPLAITWEMFRRGGWELAFGFLGANALPLLLLTALRYDGALAAEEPVMLLMQLMLLQVNVLAFGVAIFIAQGSASRLYVYPITTASLVASHMIPAAVLMASQVVVSTLIINSVFDLKWALWGPALFSAVAVVTIQASLWFSEKSAWLPWLVGLFGAVLGLWLKSQYGPMFAQPTHPWTEVTPLGVVFLLAIAVLSYWLGIIGVARNRCGEPLGSFGIIAWLNRVFDSEYNEGLSLRTPEQAQFWFEWTKKGWAMPAVVVTCLVAGLGTWGIFVRDPEALMAAFLVGGNLLSGLAVLGGLVFGNTGPNDSNFDMGNFLGTRPMKTIDMSRTILKAGALSIVIAWGIWFVAFAHSFAILYLMNAIPESVFENGVYWWYLPATLLGFWTVFAIVTSGTMMGQLKWWGPIFVGLLLSGIVLLALSKFLLSPEVRSQLLNGILATSGIAFVVGTMWAYARAYRVSFVNSTAVWGAAIVWGALSGVVVYEWVQHPIASFPVYLFAIGLMAVAVAPIATAPLALAWNRNQ